ncbi:MAG: ABC transporter ATP-binding protein [Clostridiales bacterium]|nr:ABC transporter ATP-binding protein [Clostridiales bacterium]
MLRLFKLLKPYKSFVIITVILALVHNGLQLVLPLLMSLMINDGITEGNLDYVLEIGVVMLLVSALNVAASILSSYCSSKVSAGFSMLLRREVFLKVESFSQSDIDKIGVSSLITRTTNDIRQIQDMILQGLRSIITVPVMLIGGSVMAFIMDPGLSTIIFVIIPVICIIAVIVAKKVIPMFDRIQKRTDRLNQLVREKLGGIRVIRAFNRSDYEDGRFSAQNLELTGMTLKINRIMALLIPIATMLLFGVIIILVYAGSVQINAMDALLQAKEIEDTVGDLQAFILYLFLIILAVSLAAAMFIMIPRANISAKRINEVLDLVPDIKMPETPVLSDDSCAGVVEFRDVCFGYPGAESPVLNNISFTAQAGKTTAIIGGTGSGKSSLVNLIPRFYDVSFGKILIDGVDIRDLSREDLTSKIGFIPQQAFLFSGTIADNLSYGKEDATEDEMWRALRISQADDFVRELPNGLYDMVSQSGTNLSGGQKQRIAIARAIIKRAGIFVFDDSFSALDFTTDAALRAALKREISGATVIIVAQRVGTIMNADKIIVLDDGHIAAQGTHSELVKTCEVYREIVESQLEKEALA